MATLASERINDSRLNPPPREQLDALIAQAAVAEPEQESPSGIHDLRETGQNPMDNLVLDNDPLRGWGEPTFGDNMIHIIDRGVVVNGNEKSPEPEPSRELVAYIRGLTDVKKRVVLLHDLNGSSLESFKKNIDKHYKNSYLKEDEYKKLISLIEDKPVVEIQPKQDEPLIPVVDEAENPVSFAEPVITHDSSEKTRVEGDADLVLEGEVLRFLGVYDYEEARLRIEQIKNEEKKKDLLTLMESLKETTNRIPAVPKPGKTVSVVGQDAPIIQDDVQETDLPLHTEVVNEGDEGDLVLNPNSVSDRSDLGYSAEGSQHQVGLDEEGDLDRDSVELEVVDDALSHSIMDRVLIHGDKFKGRELTSEILLTSGLSPKYKIKVGDSIIWFSSSAYNLGEGRIGVVAYVEKDGEIMARSYYRSNSQGVWRYLPAYKENGDEDITWFDKGYGEESITLPIAMQKALSEITRKDSFIISVDDPELIFAGTAKKHGNGGDYFNEIESQPKRFNGDLYHGQDKISPESIKIDLDKSPNFSDVHTSWTQNSLTYGEYLVEVFSSNDGSLKYMFCKDSSGRVWIGGIEDNSEVQSTGLKKNWIQGGDLTTPAYEYDDQDGNYGNYNLRNGSYVDMYENYLSKIPVIQAYLKSRHEKDKRESLLNEQSNTLTDSPETTEIIKTNLDVARENYARAKIEFNKKNTKYNKIKGSLEGLLSGGILSGRSKDKSPTEIELEEAQANLNEAMSAYIKEKATRKDEIIKAFDIEAKEKEKNGAPLTSEQKGEIISQIKIKLLEQAEKEWDLLQGQIAELSSVESEKFNKIKEVVAKGVKVWSKVPLAARLALAPILIGTGVGLTAGLGAGALYAGTRLGRGLGGMVGSRFAGSLYDKRADRINAEAKEETASGYENLEKSFEEREADYMKAKEEEVKRKNSQRIKKAMVMVGAGAGAGILTGLAESALSSGGAVRAAGSVETVNKPKLSVSPKTSSFDGVIKPGRAQASVLEAVSDKKEVGTSGLDAVKAPAESMTAPVTVELSSKGFLQDIHTLKANIIKEYGDNIPEEIKTKIIDKPTVEIAKEYGLYKPGDVNESAMGYAGEKLSLDSNGKLIIERVDGTKETLSGLGREGVKAALPEVDTNTPSVPTPEKLADVPVDTAVIGNKVMPEWDSRNVAVEHAIIPDEPKIIPTVDTTGPENLVYQIPHKNSLVDVVTNNGEKVVKIGDLAIAHEKVFGSGKMLMLDDIYQDGPKYKDIREAFALAFEKSANVDQIGQNPTAIEFEGGKIYIVQGLKNDPMGMKVLLNGKEIASGSMEVKGSVLGPKLKFDSSLKGGWFLDDNAYERAFKNVKKFLQIK